MNERDIDAPLPFLQRASSVRIYRTVDLTKPIGRRNCLEKAIMSGKPLIKIVELENSTTIKRKM